MMASTEISCVIVQMRLGSSRLPQKMTRNLCGWSVAEWVSEGVEASNADKIIYALPHSDHGSHLHSILKRSLSSDRTSIIFGDEDNVFDRFQSTLVKIREQITSPEISLIRVCGDRPLIQPENINILIKQRENGLFFNHQDNKKSYLGFGAERLSSKLTNDLFFGQYCDDADKEHVTKNVYKIEGIKKQCIWDPEVYQIVTKFNLRKLDLDTYEDFQRLQNVILNYSLSPKNRLPS